MNTIHLNILLADDDLDDCNFFKHALEELSLSAQLTTVHDGEELMQYLNNVVKAQNLPAGQAGFASLPDVLFLDINMPLKNGLECLTELKRDPKLKDIPVVMFSTSNSWDTINMLFNSGSDVYIHKPNYFAQLKQVIKHALPIAAEKIVSNPPLKYILNASNSDRPKHTKKIEKEIGEM